MSLALALLLQDKWLFEDKFTAAPGKGYAWVRQDAAASKVEKGSLYLKPLPGQIWEKDATQKNILTREIPAYKAEEGSIVFEVLVKDAAETEYEQAGLLLYKDDDTYVKLCRERVKGKNQIVFARELGGVAYCPGERDDPAPSHRLRLRWEPQKLSAEILPQGAAKWITAGYCEPPFRTLDGVKVGLYATGAAADSKRWAQFSEFRIGHAPAPE
jgi:regulation of enolase protein 1 (concanavalin A-like superfamily)